MILMMINILIKNIVIIQHVYLILAYAECGIAFYVLMIARRQDCLSAERLWLCPRPPVRFLFSSTIHEWEIYACDRFCLNMVMSTKL